MAYSNNVTILRGILDAAKERKSREVNHSYDEWLTARNNVGEMPLHLAAKFGSFEAFQAFWELRIPPLRQRDGHKIKESLLFRNQTADGRYASN